MQTYRPFPERTGNPWRDNAARNANRSFNAALRGSMRVHARGRRRRKEILAVEGARYAQLVFMAAQDRQRRD